MAGATWWEVHEYDRSGTPSLVFTAGAGGHAAADDYGTTFYVEREEGWRDGADMRQTSIDRLSGDGQWVGDQYKNSKIITLSGFYVAKDQEGMYASLRLARNTLGRQRRTGRLLAHDSDGRRIYANVTRGGMPIMAPTSPVVGQWSMAFKMDEMVYYSEEWGTATLSSGGAPTTGRAYTGAFPYAYRSGISLGGGSIFNGGDVPGPFVATIKGPLNGFTLVDGSTGRTLRFTDSIPAGSTAILDTRNRTLFVDGRNRRSSLFGSWFSIPPGDSVITFTPENGTTATECVITYAQEAWGA